MAVAEPVELGAVALEQTFQKGRQRDERVIYYRSPKMWPDGRENVQADWIIWGDSQPALRAQKMQMGFQPILPSLYLKGSRDPEGAPNNFDLYGPWGPILGHPQGPAQFPVSQLLAYRWYDREALRLSCNGNLPDVRFPQLRGERIVEFACPECNDRKFSKAGFLARHLRNSHDYETKEIFDLGESLGIDFRKEFKGSGGVVEVSYELPDEPETPPDVPDFEREIVNVPSRKAK